MFSFDENNARFGEELWLGHDYLPPAVSLKEIESTSKPWNTDASRLIKNPSFSGDCLSTK